MSDAYRAALTDYVEKAKAAGMSYDEVHQGLISGGWDAAMVDQMLPEVFGEHAAAPPAAAPPAQPPAYTPPAAAPVTPATDLRPAYSAPPAYQTPAGDGLGAWISKGWAMVTSDVWTFVLATLVMGLLACTVILAPPMIVGYYRMLLKKYDGKPVAVGDLFEGFQYFGAAWGAFAILMAVGLVVGGIVGAIAGKGGQGDIGPQLAVQGISNVFGWVLMTFTLFMFPLIADDREGAIGAITISINTALSNFLIYLVLVILCQLIMGAGAIACLVGMFFTMPVGYAAMVACYRSRFPAK